MVPGLFNTPVWPLGSRWLLSGLMPERERERERAADARDVIYLSLYLSYWGPARPGAWRRAPERARHATPLPSSISWRPGSLTPPQQAPGTATGTVRPTVFIWARLGLSVVIWACLGPSVYIWARLGSSVFIWARLGPSVFIWARLGSSVFIWARLGSSEPVCVHLGPSGPLWTRFGHVFLHLGLYGPDWAQLGLSVHNWVQTCLTLFPGLMPCMRRTLSCLSLVCKTRWTGLFSSYCALASTMCVCVCACVLPYCSSCLWCTWTSMHTLGAHACFLISHCLLFASVGQASAKTTASLARTLFTSLLTHRLVLLWVDACYFIFWDLPGDVLAAPESALCGWIGVRPLSSLLLILA